MATKKAKKVENVDLSKSINKIKATAKKVNTQVMETAGEVAVDLKENSENLKDAAIKMVDGALKTVKETVSKVNLKDGVSMIKDAAKTANKYTLETADEVVEATLKGTEQWQGVTAKAVKGGLKLAEKQQDIVFSTLEALKGQVVESANRFRGLFSKN